MINETIFERVEKMDKKNTTVMLVVSSGQYETAAAKVLVNFTTLRGLLRRARQLSREHSVYGDNWAGWLAAKIAIADRRDRWGENQIIGGKFCEPFWGWLDLSDSRDFKRVLAAKGVYLG